MLTFFFSRKTVSLSPAPSPPAPSSPLSVFARFLRLLRSPKTHFRPVFLHRVHTASFGAEDSQRDFDSRQESHAFRVLPAAEGGEGGDGLWSACGVDVDCATGVIDDMSDSAFFASGM